MAADVRLVAFIRTTSFLKAIGMFDPESVVEVSLWRTARREHTKEEVGGFLYREREVRDAFVVDWKRKRVGGRFPLEKMRRMIVKADLGDMVLEHICHTFESQNLVDQLNDEIEIRAKGRKDVIYLKDGTKFYATYKSNKAGELNTLPEMKALNRYEADKYGFKLCALDLVDLRTERSIKYGEKEYINVNEDADLLRAVLRDGLDVGGWPSESRTVAPDGESRKRTIKPAAIRQYRLNKQKSWQLAQAIEV